MKNRIKEWPTIVHLNIYPNCILKLKGKRCTENYQANSDQVNYGLVAFLSNLASLMSARHIYFITTALYHLHSMHITSPLWLSSYERF